MPSDHAVCTSFALAQKDQRGNTGDKIAIGMKLLNKRGNRCKMTYAGDTVLASSYGFSTSVTMEGNVRPQSFPYTLCVQRVCCECVGTHSRIF